MPERDFSEEVKASERRQSDRKKLIVDVRFEGGDATGIANTRDIGSGGLYMATNYRAFESGTPILMTILIGDREVVLEGVVAYVDFGQGVGISFRNVALETGEFLKRELELE